MMKLYASFIFLPIFFLMTTAFEAIADVVPKTYVTKRLTGTIKIDGFIDDDGWKNIPVADDFIQLDPTEGQPVSQRTEVRVTYDNTAVYISAMMFDSSPDTILHELGLRDESDDLNADYFKLAFDTYNNRQDGYIFQVSASGVQTDYKTSDRTYDCVWQSAVQLRNDGWALEIKIPYSAIRFPKKDEQLWGVQFARFIRRNREYDQWTLTPKKSSNLMIKIEAFDMPDAKVEGQIKCNCKKSMCVKKYCECFSSGAFCTSSCNCMQCSNMNKKELR